MPTIAEQLTQLTQDRDDLVDNLTTKGITGLTGDETFTELVPEVLNIPSGGGTPAEVEEKDVNFYDYDGTRLYSYTASEFANLSAMPENPSHDGLTAQGWNWNLTDAKSQVNELGVLDIGQLYVTDTGETRIYIYIPAIRETRFFYRLNGSATINWGDGTEDVTISGTSTESGASVNHTYSSTGNYVIKVKANNTNSLILGYNASVGIFNEQTIPIVQKIEMGEKELIGDASFKNANNLKTISINSNSFQLNKTEVFRFCESLKCVVIPNVITLGNYFFDTCRSLKKVIFSSTLTSTGRNAFSNTSIDIRYFTNKFSSTGQSVFQNTNCMQSIIIPNNLKTLGITSFYNCKVEKIKFLGTPTALADGIYQCPNLFIIDLSNCTSIPSVTSISMHSNGKIIVPDDLYDDWIVATNWSNYASKIVKASEA